MSLVDRLLRSVTGSQNPEVPGVPISSSSIAGLLGAGARTLAGVDVTERKAMGLTAVWRAVALTSSTPAALPLPTYRLTGDGERERVTVPVLDSPHPELTPFELWEFAYVSRNLWGNAYLQKVRDGLGKVVELWPIEPGRVGVGRVRPTASNPSGKVFSVRADDGRQLDWTSREVLHIPGLGYDGVCGASPIRVAAQSLGIGMAAEEYGARFFGNGSMLAGVLQSDQRLEQKDAEALHQRWTAKVSGLNKAHDIVVLGNNTKYVPIGIPPRDAAFLETRVHTVSDAARIWGLPPHLLGETQKSTSYGAGIEGQGIQFVVYTLRPDLTRFEQRITQQLCPPGVFAEYNVEGLLRGDSKARAAFYQSAILAGWMTRAEARRLENLPAIDGLEQPLTPAHLAAIGSAPSPTPPSPEDDNAAA